MSNLRGDLLAHFWVKSEIQSKKAEIFPLRGSTNFVNHFFQNLQNKSPETSRATNMDTNSPSDDGNTLHDVGASIYTDGLIVRMIIANGMNRKFHTIFRSKSNQSVIKDGNQNLIHG